MRQIRRRRSRRVRSLTKKSLWPQLGRTLCVLLKISPRNHVASLASLHEVQDNFFQLVETENVTRGDRCRRTAALKLNVAAFHWWAVGDSNQIWRLPIHTAVLDAAEISTNPGLNMKISSTAEFGYERRLTARVVEKTNKLILTRNRASMVWIELVLIIAKINDHVVIV